MIHGLAADLVSVLFVAAMCKLHAKQFEHISTKKTDFASGIAMSSPSSETARRYFPHGRLPPHVSESNASTRGLASVLRQLQRLHLQGLLMLKTTLRRL